MIEFPFTTAALKIEQPLGVYYVTVLTAELLLEVAFSDTVKATLPEGQKVYRLEGTQRAIDPKRLKAIAEYIDREDAAFPNSIILAANHRSDTGETLSEEEEGDTTLEQPSERWSVHENLDGTNSLTIPTPKKLAAIIDGQHRIFAFTKAHPARLVMPLICSVFVDLPKPYQAQLFATINSTQKQVPKNLTYELFGYNVEAESEAYWSPDKLAVFLSRRLALDELSPFYKRVAIAPQKDSTLALLAEENRWKVSIAVLVEGIMRLYTNNPKKDTTDLLEGARKTRAEIAGKRNDTSPLRDLYLQSQDAVLYTAVLNYLRACEEIFWSRAAETSFITRTVGVQALFDVLRKMASAAYTAKRISREYFMERLLPARDIDFAGERFRNASGSGRTTIRRALEEAVGL